MQICYAEFISYIALRWKPDFRNQTLCNRYLFNILYKHRYFLN